MSLKELVSQAYKSTSKIDSNIEVGMHTYFVNENKKAGIKLKHIRYIKLHIILSPLPHLTFAILTASLLFFIDNLLYFA